MNNLVRHENWRPLIPFSHIYLPLCNNLQTIFTGTYKSFIFCVNNNGGSRNCLWKLTLRLRDRQGRCGPFYWQIRQGSQSKDTATQHTDTHWPLDITIIHSLAILRQKHNIIRWEIPNSQLNLNKCLINVVTMNTIANLPLSINSDLHCLQRVGHFYLFYVCMFAPASCYCIGIAWHH